MEAQKVELAELGRIITTQQLQDMQQKECLVTDEVVAPTVIYHGRLDNKYVKIIKYSSLAHLQNQVVS